MLVRTYASQLLDYRYEQIQIKSTVEDASGKKAKVRTIVNRDGADAVPITYSLRKKKDAWVVYDVEIEGISLVTNYRSAFADEAEKNGVGELAKKLAKKNSEELSK
jgi:phospholipid transport system substrate-binding protein